MLMRASILSHGVRLSRTGVRYFRTSAPSLIWSTGGKNKNPPFSWAREDEKNKEKQRSQFLDSAMPDLLKSDTQTTATHASEREDSGAESSVKAALGTNVFVAAIKAGTWLWTGSGSMFSEALHSLADISNQALLMYGIKASAKAPSKKHPYGYGNERFIWALISAVGVFFLGAGTSMYHGIHSLMEPHSIEHIQVALGVLAVSFVAEGYSCSVAVRSIRDAAKAEGITFWKYLREGRDVMSLAVLFEDGAALLGVALAGGCIALTTVTGNSMFDSIGSILIGNLLGAVAVFLVRKNQSLLLGQAAPPEQVDRVVNILLNCDIIKSVHEIKTISQGSTNFRFKAEVEFDGEAVARKYLTTNAELQLLPTGTKPELEAFLLQYGGGMISFLGDEVDRIEKHIKSEVPECEIIDLESN